MAEVNRSLPESKLIPQEIIDRYRNALLIDKDEIGTMLQVRHIDRNGADLFVVNGNDGTGNNIRSVPLSELGTKYVLYGSPGPIDKSSATVTRALRQKMAQRVRVPSEIGGVPVRETATDLARRINRQARRAGQNPEEVDL